MDILQIGGLRSWFKVWDFNWSILVYTHFEVLNSRFAIRYFLFQFTDWDKPTWWIPKLGNLSSIRRFKSRSSDWVSIGNSEFGHYNVFIMNCFDWELIEIIIIQIKQWLELYLSSFLTTSSFWTSSSKWRPGKFKEWMTFESTTSKIKWKMA